MQNKPWRLICVTIILTLFVTRTSYADHLQLQKRVVRQVALYGSKNINAVIDASGKIIENYNYSPNGINQTIDMADSKSFQASDSTDMSIQQDPFQYSGEYQDLESGLYYQRARYYNPMVQRFIQRDSYNLINRYNYADDNPITNIDPSGHITQLGSMLLAAFAVVPALFGIFFPGSSSIRLVLGNFALAGIGLGLNFFMRMTGWHRLLFLSNAFSTFSFIIGLGSISYGLYQGYRGAKLGMQLGEAEGERHAESYLAFDFLEANDEDKEHVKNVFKKAGRKEGRSSGYLHALLHGVDRGDITTTIRRDVDKAMVKASKNLYKAVDGQVSVNVESTDVITQNKGGELFSAEAQRRLYYHPARNGGNLHSDTFFSAKNDQILQDFQKKCPYCGQTIPTIARVKRI